ncbi:hypothetical protein AXG93_4343s1590 [Marchantia polymorpha subsp. ruderalis]|uniref:Uncharacterized protein n=1 Tax=Marchantia polymorpha subsp. ruderalis TaxID=1480154 RepID=A0A176VUB3_MARPO|nr:hypothetical protein AXG93_4343s1590 [Marchantia polymorpha subsp. ruderalis]
MCYMSDAVQTETNVPAENAGNVIWQWLFGKVDAISTYVNNGTQDGYIGLGAPSLARVLPIDLAVFGEEIICQSILDIMVPWRDMYSFWAISARQFDVFQAFERDSFLCSINDVSVSPVATRRARPGMFGGENLNSPALGICVMKLQRALTFIQKHLARGEVLVVDAGCLVAMTTSVELELKYAGPLKRAFFGGENLLHAHLTGPGVVFVQSLPFFRLAQKIARTVTAPRVKDSLLFIVFFLSLIPTGR